MQDSPLLSPIFILTKVWGCRRAGRSALARLEQSCLLGQETPGTLVPCWHGASSHLGGPRLGSPSEVAAPHLGSTPTAT